MTAHDLISFCAKNIIGYNREEKLAKSYWWMDEQQHGRQMVEKSWQWSAERFT